MLDAPPLPTVMGQARFVQPAPAVLTPKDRTPIIRVVIECSLPFTIISSPTVVAAHGQFPCIDDFQTSMVTRRTLDPDPSAACFLFHGRFPGVLQAHDHGHA